MFSHLKNYKEYIIPYRKRGLPSVHLYPEVINALQSSHGITIFILFLPGLHKMTNVLLWYNFFGVKNFQTSLIFLFLFAAFINIYNLRQREMKTKLIRK